MLKSNHGLPARYKFLQHFGRKGPAKMRVTRSSHRPVGEGTGASGSKFSQGYWRDILAYVILRSADVPRGTSADLRMSYAIMYRRGLGRTSGVTHVFAGPSRRKCWKNLERDVFGFCAGAIGRAWGSVGRTRVDERLAG